ncbi:unnamed protein product [Owenia fusiformis]|uniref:Uncharacterized protein n=1 Tax=Owenia fusiformis TaxID=6347 RepID=A0A8J1U5F1_OWEFU|nr:unnamed protein product [Owenia fusiformis]
MGNSIKPHIERAEKSGACQLGKQGLDEFPPELQKLVKNLRTLDLSENKISSIPPSIGAFLMLKSLNLNQNRLGGLPNELSKLKKLESLLVSNNRLTSIPTAFVELKALRTVSLSHNQLKTFPLGFCGLKNLDVIDLSHNKILEIPHEVNNMQAIEINLNQNQISRLSESIAECPRLKVLRLEENCLELKAFTTKIMKESQICLLAIEGNVFDNKAFHNLDGYEEYMERYTATKKKFN